MTLTREGWGGEGREEGRDRRGESERNGLGLVMSCNWQCRICSECPISKDIWTVGEFSGVSWQ